MSSEKHDHVKRSTKEIFLNNLLGGFAWGIGLTIGLAVFVAILSIISAKIDFVPIVGDFVSNVVNYIIRTNKLSPAL